MKKMYIEPEIEVVAISAENVILSTSGGSGGYTLSSDLVHDGGGFGSMGEAL